MKFGTRGLDVGGELASILLRRANNLALATRHGTYALAALTALVDPTSRAGPAGKWLMTGLVAWALYRLATRSRRGVLIAIDCLFILAICATTPLLNASVESLDSSAQLAIVGTAIIGFTVALPAHVSLAITALVLTTYAWGAASVVGWEDVAAMVSLHYLPIAAVMGVLLRITLLRVAAATRRAHENYVRAGEMRKWVAAAARDYEREQFALLHDTVASTLLLVGNGTAIPRDRLAAPARSALDVIDGQRSAHTPRRIELVAALRELAGGTCTPVRFSGSSRLWLDGKLTMTLAAATREMLNNVDRHAHATQVSVDVSDHRIVVSDDGRGFTPTRSTDGHGVAQSIAGRMNRIGGTATIHSARGQGTAVELSWPDRPRSEARPSPVIDADRLFKRIGTRYGYALVGWALLVVILTVPYSLESDAYPHAQVGFSALAALSCLAALPALQDSDSVFRWIGITTLLFLTMVQPAVLPVDLLLTTAQWSLWGDRLVPVTAAARFTAARCYFDHRPQLGGVFHCHVRAGSVGRHSDCAGVPGRFARRAAGRRPGRRRDIR